MQPDITFVLFGTEVIWKAYAVFTVLGAAAAAALALPLLRRAGLTYRRSLVLLIFMAVGFLTGARLLNFLVNPDAYGGSLHLWTLKLKGFSVYGGIGGAIAAVLIWLRLVREKAWPVLDALTLPFGIAFALARVGCFLNGCCSGKPTSGTLGVVFPSNQPDNGLLSDVLDFLGKTEIAVYPTQLFELALALIGLIPAMLIYFRGKSPQGTAFLLYGIWFSAMRLAVLPFRSLPYPDIVIYLVYPLLYAAAIAVGLYFFSGCTRNTQRRQRQLNNKKAAFAAFFLS